MKKAFFLTVHLISLSLLGCQQRQSANTIDTKEPVLQQQNIVTMQPDDNPAAALHPDSIQSQTNPGSTSITHTKNNKTEKPLISIPATAVTELEWKDSFGKKQVIVKYENQWYYAGMEALDSAAFERYLQLLTFSKVTKEIELPLPGQLNLAESLIIKSDSLQAQTTISVYKTKHEEYPFLLHSSDHPKVVFRSAQSGLYKHIFSDLRVFWPYGK